MSTATRVWHACTVQHHWIATEGVHRLTRVQNNRRLLKTVFQWRACTDDIQHINARVLLSAHIADQALVRSALLAWAFLLASDRPPHPAPGATGRHMQRHSLRRGFAAWQQHRSHVDAVYAFVRRASLSLCAGALTRWFRVAARAHLVRSAQSARDALAGPRPVGRALAGSAVLAGADLLLAARGRARRLGRAWATLAANAARRRALRRCAARLSRRRAAGCAGTAVAAWGAAVSAARLRRIGACFARIRAGSGAGTGSCPPRERYPG
jgi:hypothetical protein